MSNDKVETIITDLLAEKYAIAGYPKKYKDFVEKYGEKSTEHLMGDLFTKVRLLKVFMQRLENAEEVIDLIAAELDLTDGGYHLYFPLNGTTPIVEKIRQYFDRGGDKVKLKKRVDELESENAVLRSLLGK